MKVLETKLENIHALGNNVLISDMYFGEQLSRSGLILLEDNGKSRGIYPRWAKVSIIGPEQTEIKVDDWILVAHGRWSRGFEVIDPETNIQTTLRKIDVKDVLMIGPDKPADATSISDL